MKSIVRFALSPLVGLALVIGSSVAWSEIQVGQQSWDSSINGVELEVKEAFGALGANFGKVQRVRNVQQAFVQTQCSDDPVGISPEGKWAVKLDAARDSVATYATLVDWATIELEAAERKPVKVEFRRRSVRVADIPNGVRNSSKFQKKWIAAGRPAYGYLDEPVEINLLAQGEKTSELRAAELAVSKTRLREVEDWARSEGIANPSALTLKSLVKGKDYRIESVCPRMWF